MKEFVKKIYGAIAKEKKKSCCCSQKNKDVSENFGYTKDELASIPEEANMGLGCGNPVAIASLREGEVVVDLGSGGGIDAFLAAAKVGKTGKVYGIDMTEAMIEKAQANATKGGFDNVEFRLGEIENIPLDEKIADCIISNCVINLAEDKQKVFNEAYRILKPGGRLMMSDMVLLAELPESIKESAQMYAGCIAGALKKDDYIDKIKTAGFQAINVVSETPVSLLDYVGSEKVLSDIVQNMSQEDIYAINNAVVSVKISAYKN